MAKPPSLRIVLPADIVTHELMRFALKEISRRQEIEPWAFSGEDAADMAREVLDAVERMEDGE